MNNFSEEEIKNILSVKERLKETISAATLKFPATIPWEGMYISGGCIASLLQSFSGDSTAEVNDIDIYFKAEKYADQVEKMLIEQHPELIAEYHKDYRQGGAAGSTTHKLITENAITTNVNKIQFIVKFWGNVDTVRQSFDYVHCMPYFDIAEDRLYISKLQYDCCVRKVLVVNNQRQVKPYRLDKFKKRGYVEEGTARTVESWKSAALTINRLKGISAILPTTAA